VGCGSWRIWCRLLLRLREISVPLLCSLQLDYRFPGSLLLHKREWWSVFVYSIYLSSSYCEGPVLRYTCWWYMHQRLRKRSPSVHRGYRVLHLWPCGGQIHSQGRWWYMEHLQPPTASSLREPFYISCYSSECERPFAFLHDCYRPCWGLAVSV